MVSYPDEPSSTRASHFTLPFRRSSNVRSPSVASSSRAPSVSTTVRRHRHGRSHAGAGSSNGSRSIQNEFPIFAATGDVEIAITDKSGRREQRYVLHRLILAQCSGFFEAGTSEEWNSAGAGAGANSSQMNGIGSDGSSVSRSSSELAGRRWKYELDWGSNGDDIPMLVQKPTSPTAFGSSGQPPPIRPRPPAPANGFFRSVANYSSVNVSSSSGIDASDEIFRTYDNLFRIFYNHPPSLDGANIANAYVECKSLLQIADMYDALEVVGTRVDHHLLRFQGRLWKQIAKYPPSYLKLGYLARSRVIFSEALIHVVGQWPQGQQQLRGQVPQAVMDLIEDKADEMEETKAKVEAKLWRLTLTTSRGERVGPHNAWLDWLVMSLWRQWFAENTTPQPTGILKDTSSRRGDSRDGPGHNRASSSSRSSTGALVRPPQPQPPPNTGRIFRLIGTGGSAYLGHDELKRFLKSAGSDAYTRDNLRRAERRMEELKNIARDAVKPLMRNFLELDVRESGAGYLTCTRVDERDWPWEED